MKEEEIHHLIKLRLEQTQECIEDAKFLLSANRGYRIVVNRSYYAAFYTLQALLVATGYSARKHRGMLSIIDAEFVKKGRLPKEYSHLIHQLYSGRLEDDYTNLAPITMEEAQSSLGKAEKFVAGIWNYMETNGYLPTKENDSK